MKLAASSPHDIHRIRAAFDDERYWQARLAFVDDASPTLDSHDTDGAGTTTMQMTMRFGGDQLPVPLQRLRLGSLHVVQREEWSALDGTTVRGEITVHAPRTPLAGRGSVTMQPTGAGTALTGTAVVDVNVPILGGKIASFVAGLLADGIVDIVRVTDTWLYANP
jgi:hypothetical protein